MDWMLIILGLVIVLTTTALLMLGVIGNGPAIVIGALGIGLIAISGALVAQRRCSGLKGS